MSDTICNYILDCREHKLIQVFENDARIQTQLLDVGDFQIVHPEHGCVMVIERKTLSDLYSSVIDGRYHEQKSRLSAMKADKPLMKVCYIVEGLTKQLDARHSKVVSGCVLNMQLRDNISVFRTDSVEDTAALLLSILKKYESEPSAYITASPRAAEHYQCTIKTRKRDNIDVKTCFIAQLCMIPSISRKKADALVSHFKVETMDALLSQLHSPATLEQVDGFGKTLSHLVYRYLKGLA